MRVRLTREAYADLTNIHTYIAVEQQQPRTASAVILKIERAFDHIGSQPLIGRKTRYPDTRELTISSLPFSVVYRVKDDCIEIITIFHESRHPDKKLR